MGHRYPPRGPIGDAVIIGSVAWPKTYSSCRERASRPAGSLARRGVLPQGLTGASESTREARSGWQVPGASASGFFAENGVRIFAIGEQTVVGSEQRCCRAGGQPQNGFKSLPGRCVAQAEIAVADDQEPARP